MSRSMAWQFQPENLFTRKEEKITQLIKISDSIVGQGKHRLTVAFIDSFRCHSVPVGGANAANSSSSYGPNAPEPKEVSYGSLLLQPCSGLAPCRAALLPIPNK